MLGTVASWHRVHYVLFFVQVQSVALHWQFDHTTWYSSQTRAVGGMCCSQRYIAHLLSLVSMRDSWEDWNSSISGAWVLTSPNTTFSLLCLEFVVCAGNVAAMFFWELPHSGPDIQTNHSCRATKTTKYVIICPEILCTGASATPVGCSEHYLPAIWKSVQAVSLNLPPHPSS